MTQINLLPWREQERQAKKNKFAIVIGIAIGITVFFILLVHLYLNSLIDSQNQRNTYLTTTLNQEQANLGDLNKEQTKQTDISTQLRFLYSLSNSSYQAVRLLDQLARTVPNGVSLSSVARNGNAITLLGKTQSNLQVTLFMKNIANSPIFKQPVLTEISSKQSTTGDEKYFQLSVEQQE